MKKLLENKVLWKGILYFLIAVFIITIIALLLIKYKTRDTYSPNGNSSDIGDNPKIDMSVYREFNEVNNKKVLELENVELSQFQARKETVGTYITGVVKNNGKEEIKEVTVKITLLNSQENEIQSYYVVVQDIKPQESKSIEVMMEGLLHDLYTVKAEIVEKNS